MGHTFECTNIQLLAYSQFSSHYCFKRSQSFPFPTSTDVFYLVTTIKIILKLKTLLTYFFPSKVSLLPDSNSYLRVPEDVVASSLASGSWWVNGRFTDEDPSLVFSWLTPSSAITTNGKSKHKRWRSPPGQTSKPDTADHFSRHLKMEMHIMNGVVARARISEPGRPKLIIQAPSLSIWVAFGSHLNLFSSMQLYWLL